MFDNRPTRFEKFVRPWETPPKTLPPPVRPAKPMTQVDEEEPESHIEWGSGNATLQDYPDKNPIPDMNADGFLATQRFAGSEYAAFSGQKDQVERPKSQQDQQQGVLVLDEIDRHVQRAIVYNPKDSEQWVAVERVLSIRFRTPDGSILKMNMKPPPAPPKPNDSATP